jgi:hypothetical protein
MEEVKRGPGRPRLPENTETDTGVRRSTRKPFGAMQQSLAHSIPDGFHGHWFNDVKDRIAKAQEAGYEHIKDRDGKNVVKVVGTAEGGGPLHGYLMMIPEEWWKEDQALYQQEVNDREAAMKRGELEKKQGDGRYIPAQGISIKS